MPIDADAATRADSERCAAQRGLLSPIGPTCSSVLWNVDFPIGGIVGGDSQVELRSGTRERTRGGTHLYSGAWFALAGVSALFGWGFYEIADPVYYDASSVSDYVAVVALTSVFVATGVALILLWRNPPVARGSVFLLFAGVGAAAEGLGNLFEDAFDIEAAVWAFFGGGLVMMVSLLIAGILALADSSSRRWSGLFLLFAVPGGMLGFGAVMMGVSWILFGLWIVFQLRAFVIALIVAAVPAVATAIYLYL